MEIINGIFSEAFWYIAPILVTLTTTIAGLINQGIIAKYVPEKHQAWLKQLIAWVLGAGLSVAAWGIKVIEFGNPVWLGVIALCAVVGLASNGVYDIPFIKNWIDKWFVKKPVVGLILDVPTSEPLFVEEKKESTACVKSVKKTHKRKPAAKKTVE